MAGARASFRLRPELSAQWTPDFDTLQLRSEFGLDVADAAVDLEREILLAMLAAPSALHYPSYEECAAAVRIRMNIVNAARKTRLAFHTSEAERPMDYWAYDDERGFTILPGKSLITALEKATQPQESGSVYAFSCYRATEYVILLAIAQELAAMHPALYERLQSACEKKAIKSRKFHDVFLHEYGSAEQPVPQGYYIPGDRLWFRNPDPHSSDASGYEGSWVFYLGGGLFSNFWKPDAAYTLTAKCLEIYHWRHGVYLDDEGEPRIDEAIVEARVQASLRNANDVAAILSQMLRMRDASGVYAEGGCMDFSRESPRFVCPGTADIRLDLV